MMRPNDNIVVGPQKISNSRTKQSSYKWTKGHPSYRVIELQQLTDLCKCINDRETNWWTRFEDAPKNWNLGQSISKINYTTWTRKIKDCVLSMLQVVENKREDTLQNTDKSIMDTHILIHERMKYWPTARNYALLQAEPFKRKLTVWRLNREEKEK